MLNNTLLLSRSDLQVLLEESHAAGQRLQGARHQLGDVLILLQDKKAELEEAEAQWAGRKREMAAAEGEDRSRDEGPRVGYPAETDIGGQVVGRDRNQQGRKNLLEDIEGGTAGGVHGGDEQRCLESAQALKALQQAVLEEEKEDGRLRSLQSPGEDRALSLKCSSV